MRTDLTAICVDDSPVELGVISRIFADNGIRVVYEAKDGQDGLNAIRRFRPSVVTLDIVLPQLNGIDILRAMRKDGIESTVFMASSMGMMRIKDECKALGAVNFIVKPYDELQTWNDIHAVVKDL